jgi:hypothetical protein
MGSKWVRYGPDLGSFLGRDFKIHIDIIKDFFFRMGSFGKFHILTLPPITLGASRKVMGLRANMSAYFHATGILSGGRKKR